MRIPFTKMHGAGNDFVVLDETRGKFGLTTTHYRRLADRHFGVGADQILSVRSPTRAGIDFEYVIHNADGTQVEQCGNGARCFARFVHERGLSNKSTLRVQTLAGVIEPQLMPDGQVTVNMGAPVFTLPKLTFDATGLKPQQQGTWMQWPLSLTENAVQKTVLLAVLSMGNPHAVQLVSDVDTAPVLTQGPLIQSHACFPEGVNVGYMQVIDRTHVRLRVFERGAGETLACGSGACAAVVVGIRLDLLDSAVHVHMRGGTLTVAWDADDAPVRMTGPATTVFRGEIEISDE